MGAGTAKIEILRVFTSGMSKFPSQDWMDEFVIKLKENDTYREAARDWEGDITFVCGSDSSFGKDIAMWFDLYHGDCRKATFFESVSDAPKSAFRYIGPFGNWVKLINGEIDPIKGVLTGKFKLEGPMMKIMRYTKAAKELVNTAGKIDTEF